MNHVMLLVLLNLSHFNASTSFGFSTKIVVWLADPTSELVYTLEI